jgi:selenocysteine lyase/cysteine desulfurase
MEMTRRAWIASSGVASVASMAGLSVGRFAASSAEPLVLPDKSQFATTINSEICLNNARWHPLSSGAQRVINEYLEYKSRGGGNQADFMDAKQKEAKVLFAQLINAKPSEISYVGSTSFGENLVVNGLELPPGANIVSDALHFEGSLYLYGAMQQRGRDVRIVRPHDWAIELSDMVKVVDGKTKLIALSLVSMTNGFEHNLKAVCDLAHAHGAYVYADIVQAAGAIPIDVKASGVDFCACASYKWLMGDMGLGFLYVREDLLDSVVRRTLFGYRQLSRLQYHLFPGDPPGERVIDWTQSQTAGGYFEVGTVSNTTVMALTHSLKYIQDLGVQNIRAHTQGLIARLRKEMPALGFETITPAQSKGPIITFVAKDPPQVAAKLRRANIDASLSGSRLRISPSVYNDDSDITHFLEALA